MHVTRQERVNRTPAMPLTSRAPAHVAIARSSNF
jgi:hypothetical protein